MDLIVWELSAHAVRLNLKGQDAEKVGEESLE